jgi:hypothetical protein
MRFVNVRIWNFHLKYFEWCIVMKVISSCQHISIRISQLSHILKKYRQNMPQRCTILAAVFSHNYSAHYTVQWCHYSLHQSVHLINSSRCDHLEGRLMWRHPLADVNPLQVWMITTSIERRIRGGPMDGVVYVMTTPFWRQGPVGPWRRAGQR